ncbi:MAG: ABC transporter permease [Egibacteraceae bacterium]
MLLALVMVVLSALGPVAVATSPTRQDLSAQFQGPSAQHLLGTDQYGRDVLARVVAGARRSLLVSLTVVGSTLLVGVVVGVIAATGGRLVDALVARFIDILLALPGFVVAVAVLGLLGRGLSQLVIAFLIAGWAPYARMARGLALGAGQRPDVLVARAAGVRRRRILLTHVAPHILRQLLVVGTVDLGYVIVGLAAFSYLGFGVQPPTPEWGSMLREGQDFFSTAPWLLIAPGAGIALTVIAVNLIGEHVHVQGVAR